MSLTKRQLAFINHYLMTFNARESALLAGYSPTSAERASLAFATEGLEEGLKMMAAMIQNGVSEVAKAMEEVINKAAIELKDIFINYD